MADSNQSVPLGSPLRPAGVNLTHRVFFMVTSRSFMPEAARAMRQLLIANGIPGE